MHDHVVPINPGIDAHPGLLFESPLSGLAFSRMRYVYLAPCTLVSQVTQRSSVASRFCALQTCAKAPMSRPDSRNGCCTWRMVFLNSTATTSFDVQVMCASEKTWPIRKLPKVKNGTGILGSVLAELRCDTSGPQSLLHTGPNYVQLQMRYSRGVLRACASWIILETALEALAHLSPC